MAHYLVVTVGILIAGCGAGDRPKPPSARPVTSGSFVVEPYREGKEHGVRFRAGQFENSDGVHVRYDLSLRQSGSPDAFLASGDAPLNGLQVGKGTGLSSYDAVLARSGFDTSRPYEAVLDYELWKGVPGDGELLSKSSVTSEPIPFSP
jgi:hypothetical protein